MATTTEATQPLTDAIVRQLAEMMRPSDECPKTLDDDSIVQFTVRLRDEQAEKVESDASGTSGAPPPLIETLHMTVHPSLGVRWVAARDFSGGQVMMHEEPLVYVTTLNDSRENPLNSRMVRRLLPDRPTRPLAVRRMFERRADIFGSEGSPTAVSMSLEWTATFVFLRDNEPDDVRRVISQMRRAGPYAYGQQLKQFINATPGLVEQITAMRVELNKLAAIASGADNAEALKLEMAHIMEEPKDEADAETYPEAEPVADDCEDRAPREWNDDVARAYASELEKRYDATKRHFDETREAYANDRRWIEVVRRSARGGREAYSVDEIVDVYSTLVVAALHMRTPVTNFVYGLAVYPGLSHAQHSCTPSARIVFESGGAVRLEALGRVAAGTVVTIDRVLHDEPLIRCLATAPEWLRRTHDGTIGSLCRCDECNAAYAWLRESTGNVSEAVELAERAIEAVWSDPPTTRRPPLDADVDAALDGYALRLLRMASWDQIVDQVGGEYIRTLLGAETSLHAFELARATVAMAARHPLYTRQSLGDDTIEAAMRYMLRQGEQLAVGKLREQGASPALTHRRMSLMRARSLLTEFTARAAPVVARINDEVVERTAGDENRAVDSLEQRLRPILTQRFGKVFATTFRFIVYATELPDANEPSTQLSAAATLAGIRRLETESLYSTVIGMTAALVDVTGSGDDGGDGGASK